MKRNKSIGASPYIRRIKNPRTIDIQDQNDLNHTDIENVDNSPVRISII